MRINEIKVIVCAPGRNVVSVRIVTDEKSWRQATPTNKAYLPLARLEDGAMTSW